MNYHTNHTFLISRYELFLVGAENELLTVDNITGFVSKWHSMKPPKIPENIAKILIIHRNDRSFVSSKLNM